MTHRDITPPESIVPVYLDPTPKPPSILDDDGLDAHMRAEQEERESNRKSAIAKLRKLGLTEEEALALAGA